jgi:hypothetical protein
MPAALCEITNVSGVTIDDVGYNSDELDDPPNLGGSSSFGERCKRRALSHPQENGSITCPENSEVN